MRYGARNLAFFLLMLAAPAAQAQLWRGPAAVEVRVEDRGAPVAGAELQLRFNGVEPKDGPPALTTDSRGRANVSGLAPGSWQVEVRRDGFMTYLAEIEVRENGRLELVQATQLKVAGASRTLDVKISKGRPAPEARAAAPVRETPPPIRETPPPPRAEPAPAPRVEPTPPPRQPETRPAPEPPREQPPAPTPQPAPQPVPQPVTPPPAPPAQTVQPTPPAVAAPPADSILMRTAKDRTCVECQPGESSLSLARVIPPAGGPGCGGDLAVRLRGTLTELPAGCDVLQIALPEGARYIGYRFEVQDGGESLDCPTAKDCPRGLGRWPADPIVIRGPQKAVVRAAFESGPADRERRAVLTVYFSMTAKR